MVLGGEVVKCCVSSFFGEVMSNLKSKLERKAALAKVVFTGKLSGTGLIRGELIGERCF